MLKPRSDSPYFSTRGRGFSYTRHRCAERPTELFSCIEIVFTQVFFHEDDTAWGAVNGEYTPTFGFDWDGDYYVYRGIENGFLYETPEGQVSLIIPLRDDGAD